MDNRTCLTCLASHTMSSRHDNCLCACSCQYQWMVKSSMSVYWRCLSCSFMIKAKFVILLAELPANTPRTKALSCWKLLPNRSHGNLAPLLFTKVFSFISCNYLIIVLFTKVFSLIISFYILIMLFTKFYFL